MDPRFCRGFDEPTSQNLTRLDNLSKNTSLVTAEVLGTLLSRITSTHELLPEVLRKKIDIHQCYGYSSLADMSQASRDMLWSDVCTDLTNALDSVQSDRSLHMVYVAGIDRPITFGERILSMLAALDAAHDNRSVAADLVNESIGTGIHSAAKELLRILERRTHPNANARDAEIRRRTAKIKSLARASYHLR